MTEVPTPAENSDVRAFVEVKPHAVMVLNPDGTRYLTTLTGNPDWGAHIISMTRAVSRKCECTATSTSFWTIFRALLSSTPPNTHRMLYSTSCPY